MPENFLIAARSVTQNSQAVAAFLGEFGCFKGFSITKVPAVAPMSQVSLANEQI
jgi:hypothetical protein